MPKSKFQMLTSTGIGRPMGSGLSALMAPVVEQRPHFVESKYCRELVEDVFDEVNNIYKPGKNAQFPWNVIIFRYFCKKKTAISI